MLPLAGNASVLLLHVASSSAPDEASDARARLEQGRRELTSRVGVDVDVEVVAGDAPAAIVRAARLYRADLTVVGGRPAAGSRIGATADSVIRTGSTPVLVVNRAPCWPYELPLVAVDLCDASAAVLDTACLVVRPAVTMRVIHAQQRPFTNAAVPPAGKGRELRREFADSRRAAIEALLPEPARRWVLTFRNGGACSVIVREIRARHADLVVLGTHARSGVERLLFGSTANWILAHAPCDVLISRPERFTSDLG